MNPPEEERLRIRLEETYRAEVKNEIASDKRSRLSWWDRLNSPIVLWVLSSVVIASLANLYSSWSESAKRHAEDIVLLDRLVADALARVDRMRINAAIVRGDVPNTGGVFGIVIASEGIYPEFKERDFRSVSTEIAVICANQFQSEKLTQISRELIALETKEDQAAAREAVPLIKSASEILNALAELTNRCSRRAKARG